MNTAKTDTVNLSIVNWPAAEYSRVATIALAVTATTANNRNHDRRIGVRGVPGQSPGRCNFTQPGPSLASR